MATSSCDRRNHAMQLNTLYYRFSSLSQVTAALAAVASAVAFFRIGQLHDYMIGDGHSMIRRWGHTGLKLDQQNDDRKFSGLEDREDRRSLHDLEEVFFDFVEQEEKQVHGIQNRPAALQYIYYQRVRPGRLLIGSLQRMAW